MQLLRRIPSPSSGSPAKVRSFASSHTFFRSFYAFFSLLLGRLPFC